MEQKISLKEFLELQIKQADLAIVHLRELIEERDKALKLLTTANEEHFERLNHEAARLALMVTKEYFDRVVGQLEKEINDRQEEIKLIQLWVSNREGKEATAKYIGIIGIIISVFSAVMWVIKYM